ncbi:TetR/AcrR family transcriptional regulator [Ancylobacter amanitiformis]|uniref:AcrR family transcriptional regulator n=1 Tax=Ancylobacter amanitiformis TaxID=217069 RepID=A0ABU0LQP0_9HYPH|nr:TetR/AcrR family transcriptional regulator [Ancylobacter amanitiformis]MDQ0510991.1 AcrR family transcriptional regulator [Ancylobacter amanitiformis]
MTSTSNDMSADPEGEASAVAAGGLATGGSRPNSDKQRRILAGARDVFLSSGFDGASMGEIARAAGVSKGTLYVYFPSKEGLFAAVVSEVCQETAEQSFALDPDADVREALTRTGHLYLRAMIRPEHIATVRMVVGIAEKLPEIGRTYLSAGPDAGVERLCGWLRGKCAAGELRVDDLELAAWQFLVGCHALIVMPMLFGGSPQPDAATVDRVVVHAVDNFMRAYGARPPEGREP